MNSLCIHRIFIYLGTLLTMLVSGCTSLPNQKIGFIDQRQVEYSLIENGNGSAIVVFENGLDGKMDSWSKIIPEISREATTFAYHRPGYGRSDPVSTPRDGLHIVDELRLFLNSNGLKPPYGFAQK